LFRPQSCGRPCASESQLTMADPPVAVSTLHERLQTHITEESDGCEETAAQAIVDALRAVVKLHAPVEVDFHEGPIVWCATCQGRPCSTITAIAHELGVEIGETPK
jgi:hypothetical protein